MSSDDRSERESTGAGSGDAWAREPEILVVEDDPATRLGLSELLRAWGFEVAQASDGETALELLKRGTSIGLVLTDLVMPRLNGLDLLRRVRQQWPQVDVILLTGQGTVETAVEAIRLGAFEYLTKPVDPQRLRILLENHVEKMERMAAASQTAPSPGDAHGSRIFLCYRREDTQDAARHLAEKLADAYGSARVFMDIDSVPLGIDFVEHVTEQISRCSVVIVMIGKQWLTIKDNKRRRRLDNEDDLVRAEIATALKLKIPVIPVMVQSASMPSAEDLPEGIRALARRNGTELSHTGWKTDVERLLKKLNAVMGAEQ